MHSKFDRGIVCYHIVNESSLLSHSDNRIEGLPLQKQKKNHGDFHLNYALTELTSDLFQLIRYSKLFAQ